MIVIRSLSSIIEVTITIKYYSYFRINFILRLMIFRIIIIIIVNFKITLSYYFKIKVIKIKNFQQLFFEDFIKLSY